MDYIAAIDKSLGVVVEKNFLPMRPGDVKATAASTESLENRVDFRPDTPVAPGVSRLVDGYLDYHTNRPLK